MGLWVGGYSSINQHLYGDFADIQLENKDVRSDMHCDGRSIIYIYIYILGIKGKGII